MKRIQLIIIGLVLFGFLHAGAGIDHQYPRQNYHPTEVVEITVGSGDQQALIPVNMYYRNSLFETIYMANEMNVAGQITHIRFYNNFMTNLPDKPTQIWLGQTNLFDLTGGWIPSSQLTEVFWGDVDYPAGQNEITIPLTNPFTYHGGNLVMMVFRPWENDYYTSMELFYAQTVGTNRSLTTFNDNTQINPDNPPTTGVTGQFPKTTFTVDVSGMGSLSGNVSSSGVPLEGAAVSIEDTYYCATTGADGNYSFPYVPAGNYDVSAAKTGYVTVSHNVGISADQTTTQDFDLPQLVQVTVSGRIVGSDAPGIGIEGASISFTGYADYTASTDAQGNFSIADVYANQTYSYTASASGYQVLDSAVTIGDTDLDMGDIILDEIAYSPQNAVATESPDGTFVDLEWEEPNVAQEGWLHYDSGENNTSFGTAGSLSFDVAIRYPPDALTDYAGGSLQAVRIWPAQGGNFSVRVWTGGDASAPGQMVVDQPIIPVLNSYNLVLLDDPVPVTATEELWFGFLCDVTGVNPAYAGMDYGPAVDGFGNMIYWQGSWTTLLDVNSYCDFNWNIQGYVGLTPPDGPPALTPISLEPGNAIINRALEGYDVWRLLQGQETNEAAWVCLTPEHVSETAFQDDGWDDIPDGNYLWAVKAVYTGDVFSEPIFSNVLANITQIGSIAGIVRDIENAPIMDATITCGDASTQTNANGAYTMQLETGTYSVTASHPDYVPVTQDSVVVLTGQTTTVNFVLDAVGIGEDEVPSLATALLGNHPNPFNPQTSIRYSLETPAQVDMRIYNLKGELIRSLLNETRQSGYHSIIWDGTDDAGIPVSSGVYYLRMKAGDYTKTGKMILMK